MNPGITEKPVSRFEDFRWQEIQDFIAIEEPLEISIQNGENAPEKVSITMRTPGNDHELAAGFLFTEGIIQNPDDVLQVRHTQTLPGIESNTILVEIKASGAGMADKLKRNFYTTSSCGVCGKASIDAIKTTGIYSIKNSKIPGSEILFSLNQKLREAQGTFDKTGGIHASGLFNMSGELIALREDVGRHNALDKLIGYMFLEKKLPLDNHILLLSGRASFELVQKAAMAGIGIIAAVGAPSSLAVETAEAFGITLIGFLGKSRFNVYSGN